MSHLENWVEDSARQRLVRDIEPIQSEWPAHTSSWVTSGYCTPNSGSASLLLSVPSTRWFKMRMLWIDNHTSLRNHLLFYAGASAAIATATIGGITVGAWETEFIAMDCVTTGKDIWVDCTEGNCHIRIGGILLTSGPEYAQE